MSRFFSPPRLPVLAVMAIVIGYQVWHSADALHFYLRGVERPFQLESAAPAVSTLGKEAASAGLKKGDTLLSINSQPIHSRADVAALERRALAGVQWAVAFQRDGKPGLAVFRLLRFNNDAGWLDWTTAVFTDFIIRWFGIILAAFVLWMRPRDPLAWLLLALLVSFGFLANSVGDVDEGWPLPWRAFAMFCKGAIGASWPLWMMLFGLDFPDPQSKGPPPRLDSLGTGRSAGTPGPDRGHPGNSANHHRNAGAELAALAGQPHSCRPDAELLLHRRALHQYLLQNGKGAGARRQAPAQVALPGA
ncbi:MAG: PDZ domain-containing protein [Bryobacterales bacterium]|nr:PDZ domain-containing protein [Bryobacterales bacterium]